VRNRVNGDSGKGHLPADEDKLGLAVAAIMIEWLC